MHSIFQQILHQTTQSVQTNYTELEFRFKYLHQKQFENILQKLHTCYSHVQTTTQDTVESFVHENYVYRKSNQQAEKKMKFKEKDFFVHLNEAQNTFIFNDMRYPSIALRCQASNEIKINLSEYTHLVQNPSYNVTTRKRTRTSFCLNDQVRLDCTQVVVDHSSSSKFHPTTQYEIELEFTPLSYSQIVPVFDDIFKCICPVYQASLGLPSLTSLPVFDQCTQSLKPYTNQPIIKEQYYYDCISIFVHQFIKSINPVWKQHIKFICHQFILNCLAKTGSMCTFDQECYTQFYYLASSMYGSSIEALCQQMYFHPKYIEQTIHGLYKHMFGWQKMQDMSYQKMTSLTQQLVHFRSRFLLQQEVFPYETLQLGSLKPVKFPLEKLFVDLLPSQPNSIASNQIYIVDIPLYHSVVTSLFAQQHIVYVSTSTSCVWPVLPTFVYEYKHRLYSFFYSGSFNSISIQVQHHDWTQTKRPTNFQPSKHLPYLQQHVYYITNKLNGEAVDIVLNQDSIQVFTQSKCIQTLPRNELSCIVQNCILHGEYFQNKIYVYGMKSTNTSFSNVLKCIQAIPVDNTHFDCKYFVRCTPSNIHHVMQQYYQHMQRTYKQRLQQDNDGIILQPDNMDQLDVIKWKFPCHITIDVRLELDVERQVFRCKTFYGDKEDYIDLPFVDAIVYADTKERIQNNDIAECSLSNHTLVPLRARREKQHPNYVDVVRDTYFDMKYPIHIQSFIHLLELVQQQATSSTSENQPNPYVQQDIMKMVCRHLTIDSTTFLLNKIPNHKRVLLLQSQYIDFIKFCNLRDCWILEESFTSCDPYSHGSNMWRLPPHVRRVSYNELQASKHTFDVIVSWNIDQAHEQYLTTIIQTCLHTQGKVIVGTLADQRMFEQCKQSDIQHRWLQISKNQGTNSLNIEVDEHTGLYSAIQYQPLCIDTFLQHVCNLANVRLVQYQPFDLVGKRDPTLRFYVQYFRIIELESYNHQQVYLFDNALRIQPYMGKYVVYGLCVHLQQEDVVNITYLYNGDQIIKCRQHPNGCLYLAQDRQIYQMIDFSDDILMNDRRFY